MGNLHLGKASEMRYRVGTIENTGVLKLIHDPNIAGNPKSDIVIVVDDDVSTPSSDSSYAHDNVEVPIKNIIYPETFAAQKHSSALENLTKVMFCKNTPYSTDVLWAKPLDDGYYQFFAYYDDKWNNVAENGDGVTINISGVSGNLSNFNNDAGYVTGGDMEKRISNKQDKIADISEIRTNAKAGADAAAAIDSMQSDIGSMQEQYSI